MSKANIILLTLGEKLNSQQETQFINIMYDAYKGKFQKHMGDEPETVKKVLSLMVNMNLFPIENRICAADAVTKEILGLILISRFEDTGIFSLLKFVVRLFSMVKFHKAVKLIKAFLKLDSLNTKSRKTCIADIYLIASKEELRGQGIGTVLMEAGLKHIKESFLYNENNKISLIVYKDNPAVRLYQRFGFMWQKPLIPPLL
jgi:ribosomal protein S18 acetylase RimI-like enzyme